MGKNYCYGDIVEIYKINLRLDFPTIFIGYFTLFFSISFIRYETSKYPVLRHNLELTEYFQQEQIVLFNEIKQQHKEIEELKQK